MCRPHWQQKCSPRSRTPDPLQELTKREREILGLIGTGLTNREIGQRISLSEKTIKHYVTNILQKLQVRSRVEAALLAAQRDIAGPR
jgi:DNA-binding NarL/FixJ family response regulator